MTEQKIIAWCSECGCEASFTCGNIAAIADKGCLSCGAEGANVNHGSRVIWFFGKEMQKVIRQLPKHGDGSIDLNDLKPQKLKDLEQQNLKP